MKSKRAKKSLKRKRGAARKAARIHRRLDSGTEWSKSPVFGGNVEYEVSDRTQATPAGGIGAMQLLVKRVGLAQSLNKSLSLLRRHFPYHESDHVLNIAYNLLAGGRCLDDLGRVRHDEAYLNALGTKRIPDSTTAGDFCRRFQSREQVEALMQGINEARLRVWKEQPDPFFEEALIDVDGTIAPTTGNCKEGMGLSYKGIWGYHPLLVSLANTGEPLFLENRSGNRPSAEGAAARLDDAIDLCRRGGFRHITLRGDTDFSQARHLDRWDEENVGIVFGFDARANLVEIARELPESKWHRLERRDKRERTTSSRRPRERVKKKIVVERGYKNLVLAEESVAEFEYSPTGCQKSYRMIVLRKDIEVFQGQQEMFDQTRYFFYITNLRDLTADEIVFHSNDRCNQERLIEQLKNGPCAMRMPLGDLLSNWAYMVMASLAWSLKAWFALILPQKGRWTARHSKEKNEVLRMSFRCFVEEFIRVPAQLVRTGRRIICRLLTWTRWQAVFLRALDVLERPLRC